MRWLWFVASLICFAVVFRTPSMGLAVLCLIGALVFMVIGVVMLAAARIDSRSRDATSLLGPEELRRIREARARREGGAAGPGAGAGAGPELGVVPMFVGGAAVGAAARGRGSHDDAALSPSDRAGDADGGNAGDGSDGGGGD